MQRISAFAGAALAGALGAFLLRRRRSAASAPGPSGVNGADPRAAELRRKLDESRAGTGAPHPAPPQRPVDEFEAMRRRIHAEAREAAERMRRSAE
jgi:hypothetical protein